MVRITNTPGDYDVLRMKPDSSLGIYITVVKEDLCRVVANNREKTI